MAPRSDFALSALERHEARQAIQILEGSGISLAEAARLALKTRGRTASSAATIEAATDGFLRRALEMRLREATFDFYEQKLRQFSYQFAGATLDAVSRAQIRDWLEALPVSPVTRRGTLRAVHALYAWARSKEPPLCQVNACEGLRIEAPRSEREPVVLHAAEVGALLAAAGPYRHALALMVFAGIRPDEMAGEHKVPLDWIHVDRAAAVVRVPAAIAKTRAARVLEQLPAVVWAWLEGGPTSGPICGAKSRQIARRCWPTLRPLRPDLTRWPVDVLRHTAASYLLALWGDAGRVSMVLGHEGKPEMIFSRYRATMTQAQAQAIAALRPRGLA